MRLGTSAKFIKISRKTGAIRTNLFNKDNRMETITEENKKLVANTIYKIFNKYSIEDDKKLILANSAIDYINEYQPELNVERITYTNSPKEFVNTPVEEKISAPAQPEIDKKKIKNTLKKFIDFFSEFSFEPNYRFVNTFSYCNTISEAIEYTTRYFELSDSPYTDRKSTRLNSSHTS